MKFGTHVSIAGGVFNAPDNAAKVGGETFQMFTRSPRGGAAPVLTPDIVKQFKDNLKKHGLTNYYVHAPYYINLASVNPKIYEASIRILREELERSSVLGVKALMIHIGSAKDQPRAMAVKKVIAGVTKILTGYKGETQFLLEISAGAGEVIGASFEEIAAIIEAVQPKVKTKIGVCFDTAHAFASGYDLRTKKDVDVAIKKFDQIIGLDRLVVIHGNDSKVDFNSHLDRHWHIGAGKIGRTGFDAIINHPKLKKIDMILETPDDDMDTTNLGLVKKLRK